MSNAKEKIKEIATKEQKDAMKEMFRMVDKSKVDEVKQMLEYTQKGTAKATVGNYMVVLRNDPLVRESMKYNKLTGVQSVLEDDGIAEDEFLDSVNFLAEEGYIHLRRISNKEPAALADTDYTALEAKLTGKGIRLLAGGIEDDMIEV